MTPAAILATVLQLLALFPTLEPAVIQAIQDFKNLFNDGNEPTQSDIDALIDKIKTQSAQIQALASTDQGTNEQPLTGA